MEWVESAEIKAIKINKNYGKKQSKIALILMLVFISFVAGITIQYTTLIYGDLIIKFARNVLSYGNFLNIIFGISVIMSFISYICTLVYSIRTIVLGKTGINNKVNTKVTLKKGITYLVISSVLLLIFIGLLITNYIIQH